MLGLRRIAALLLGLWLAFAASPAAAEWKRAESERFVVYSEGDERALKLFVDKLETYDRFLRARMRLPVDEAPYRKLPIYLVTRQRDMAEIWPDVPETVAGFYTSSEEDIFAVAVRDRDDDTLLHEYAHHFMLNNFNFPYPGWFVEGFAEYYMTFEVERSALLVGRPNANRVEWLQNAGWTPLEELLTKRPFQVTRNRETYYPLAWLMTHWFMSDPARKSQLDAYLRAVGTGGDPARAMETATGMPLETLRRTLVEYSRRPLLFQGYRETYTLPPVTITRMGRAADDLLLFNQRLKRNQTEEQRKGVLTEARRRAALHPDDPLALLVLGHAELHFEGDRAAGDRALDRLLEQKPDHVEALQLKASALVRDARNLEGAAATAKIVEARRYLSRAYQADEADFTTLIMLAESREGQPGYPNDNDLATWEQAFTLAPQLSGVRVNYASVLAARDRKADAIRLLEPLASDPHNRGAATAARNLINRLKGVTAEPDAEDAPGTTSETTPPAAPALHLH